MERACACGRVRGRGRVVASVPVLAGGSCLSRDESVRRNRIRQGLVPSVHPSEPVSGQDRVLCRHVMQSVHRFVMNGFSNAELFFLTPLVVFS